MQHGDRDFAHEVPATRVHCRNGCGRRGSVFVSVDADRLCISFGKEEHAALSPLQVGRLRAALRDALFSMNDDDHE